MEESLPSPASLVPLLLVSIFPVLLVTDKQLSLELYSKAEIISLMDLLALELKNL